MGQFGCGTWSIEENMNMYAPNDPEKILKWKFGDKTVREIGEIPYVVPSDLEEHYHLIKELIHTCKCGNRLYKASDAERDNIGCPQCGTKNEYPRYMDTD